MQQTWDSDVVKAREIMTRANYPDPNGFVLEALDRPGGDVKDEFAPDQDVDLREDDRKHFRVTPGGSGRS